MSKPLQYYLAGLGEITYEGTTYRCAPAQQVDEDGYFGPMDQDNTYKYSQNMSP